MTDTPFTNLRDLIAETAADLSNEEPFWTAGCLADALIKKGITHTQQSDTPVATDVAALVEALKWFLTGDRDVSGQALIYDGHWEQIATRIDSARKALAPFTKGQNDDA